MYISYVIILNYNSVSIIRYLKNTKPTDKIKMNTLFMECYKSLNYQNLPHGKNIVIQSTALDESTCEIYMQHTYYKEIEVISNDRYGLDIKLELFKKNGSITLLLHRKRKSYVHISFCDASGSEVFNIKNVHHTSLIFKTLLSEFPNILSDYIFNKKLTKKWNDIMNLCVQLSNFHTKSLNVYIYIVANKTKKFIYNLDENHLT